VESSASFPSTADTAALSPADMDRPERRGSYRRKIAVRCCAKHKQ
jgi:hypothetical protein